MTVTMHITRHINQELAV